MEASKDLRIEASKDICLNYDFFYERAEMRAKRAKRGKPSEIKV